MIRSINLPAATLALLLAACVANPALDISTYKLEKPSDALAGSFVDLCLSGNDPGAWLASSQANGWQIADDAGLEANGLKALKRQVLEVPGGGANVRESQQVLQQTLAGNFIALSLEEMSARDGAKSAKCSMYSTASELLGVCAAIGKSLKRAPDQNNRYRGRQAQFIAWNMGFDGRPLRVACEQAPQSALLAYEGVVLSATLDLTRIKAAAKPAAASPREH